MNEPVRVSYMKSSAGRRFTGAGRRVQPLGALLGLALGWYASLFLLFSSLEWNWELNEQPRIDPKMLMAMRRDAQEGGTHPIALLSGDEARERPSLIWYLNFWHINVPRMILFLKDLQSRFH